MRRAVAVRETTSMTCTTQTSRVGNQHRCRAATPLRPETLTRPGISGYAQTNRVRHVQKITWMIFTILSLLAENPLHFRVATFPPRSLMTHPRISGCVNHRNLSLHPLHLLLLHLLETSSLSTKSLIYKHHSSLSMVKWMQRALCIQTTKFPFLL